LKNRIKTIQPILIRINKKKPANENEKEELRIGAGEGSTKAKPGGRN
jgi:hypothetical protein